MIEFLHITKHYKDTRVLHDISLTVQDGETVCLVGESGSGKTTLLKMINRLIDPTSGQILIDGADIAKQDILTLRRNIGYVIQQTGLFPHMTIEENIGLIPTVTGQDPAAVLDRTRELLDMVGLDPHTYLGRYPAELSGGQQQRVGVARAFACDPDIILMDEPFSALDPLTRASLQDEIIQIQSEVHKTIVFVTHDMDEAVRLGDRICIIDKGHILQYDTPEQLMKAPNSDFVAQFIGTNRIWSSPDLIRAEDIMLREVETCGPQLSAMRALEKMHHAHVNGLLVIERASRRLLGMVTARALQAASDRQAPVSRYMQTDLETIRPQQSMVEMLPVINQDRVALVPVVDDGGRLCGLITESSLVTTLSQPYLSDEEVSV